MELLKTGFEPGSFDEVLGQQTAQTAPGLMALHFR